MKLRPIMHGDCWEIISLFSMDKSNQYVKEFSRTNIITNKTTYGFEIDGCVDVIGYTDKKDYNSAIWYFPN
jgi:hypothetical protein